MMTDSVSRTTRRSEAMRAAIVAAASELVNDGGAASVTLEAVARRADVAVQTIYNRVGGRTELLAAVTDLALDADRAHMDAAYLEPGTPVERIERAARAYSQFADQCPDQFRLLASPPDDADTRARIAALVAEQNAKLSQAIADGIADESIRADLEPNTAATALWAMMNGLLLHHVSTPSGDPIEPLLTVAFAMIRSGLERQ